MDWIRNIRRLMVGIDRVSILDAHGQPRVQAFRSEAIIDRQIDELIGLIKGIMADGMVDQSEAEFLLRWMDTNKAARDRWPAKAIYPRLVAALADGKLDLDEQREILDLLVSAVGGNTAPMHGESSDSTALPLTSPAPCIAFAERLFCFTGKFHSGTRQWCETQVTMRGGMPAASVTRKLDYLVIGEIGSRDWIHSTHGRKIEKAIEYNDAGGAIVIVGEEHWFEHLK
jgi:NAD-dependent DNA ligase